MINMTKIKTFLTVIILVTVFLLGSLAGWIIKPGAKTNQPAATAAKVIVNPGAKETKKADVAVKIVSRGRLSGTARVDKSPDPDRSNIEVSVPVSGEIMAKYVNAKTGDQIGKDTRKLTGETTVQVTDD